MTREIAGEDDARYRYADGICDDARNRLILVREDHSRSRSDASSGGSAADVVNEIVAVDADDGTTRALATGNDFYAAPRLSPDGTRLAYVTWNHPNMPWDATELRVVDLSSDDADTRNHVLVAGADGDTSVLQPMWRSTKDGTNELYYVSDETGYYNIWRSVVGETTNVNVNVNVNVLPMSHDFGGSAPGWILGAPQGFRFASDGRLVATYGKDGHTRLVVADVPENGVAVNVQEYSGHPDDGHGLPRLFGDVETTSVAGSMTIAL